MMKFCVILYMLTSNNLGKHLCFVIIRCGLNVTFFSHESVFIFTVANSPKVCSAIQSRITCRGWSVEAITILLG